MRAVWSFWSKPHLAGTGGAWPSSLHHLLAWGLSVRLGRAHYPNTSLVTDAYGAALLADRLGLPFTSVSTALDCLEDADPALWMAGKLVTYGLQDAPFVHLDTDVFLWRALPAWLVSAPVFAQHLDEFPVTPDCGPRVIESAFGGAGLALPVEWQWFRSLSARRYREANLGIFGGTDLIFIRYFAAVALDLAVNPAHAAAWSSIEHPSWMNPTVEQFVFTACAEYHRFAPSSPHRGLHARYLFPTGTAAYDPEQAGRAGYTHLLGPAKQHPVATARLLARMRAEDPAFYTRCEAVSDGLATENSETSDDQSIA